jgi:uncharacterized RDD family membrane protein YckC
MEIWIIKDGEKAGPFNDFDIRGRIENHEIPPTTPAWHEGMPEWRPLHTISLFDSAFERANDTPSPLPSRFDGPLEQPKPAAPPPLDPPPSAFPVRRFWARWFDLSLFAGVWWLLMWASGRDIMATLENSWIMLLHYIPWFVIEAILLHRYGLTPGKWLLGLRVVNDNGSLLTLPEATRRSARVLFIGIGFGWFLVSQICQLMSYFTTRRLGRPLWDQAGGHRVFADALNPIRLLAYIFILAFSVHVKLWVILPHFIDVMAKSQPEMREQLEQQFRWYLPEKK